MRFSLSLAALSLTALLPVDRSAEAQTLRVGSVTGSTVITPGTAILSEAGTTATGNFAFGGGASSAK